MRVVVRDSNGNAVASLKKEDFRLLDGGKPQTISTFTIETPESRVTVPSTEEIPKETPAPAAVAANATPASPAIAIPQRFVALVFDDVHFQTKDALAVRDAITRISAAISSSDRVAVYTTSGEVSQEFTDDRETIHKTLLGILPRQGPGKDIQECNDLSYYEADLIVNRQDMQALAVATLQAKTNCGLGSQDVLVTARRVLTRGARRPATRITTWSLSSGTSNMPGQRVIVLVSPGFVMGQDVQSETWNVIDRAVRSGIVINTIDARGLYTADVLPDIAAPPQLPASRQDPKSTFKDRKLPTARRRNSSKAWCCRGLPPRPEARTFTTGTISMQGFAGPLRRRRVRTYWASRRQTSTGTAGFTLSRCP